MAKSSKNYFGTDLSEVSYEVTSRGWYDKWHAYMYGDALAKQGTRYKNVFLDDLKKMKKNISSKT